MLEIKEKLQQQLKVKNTKHYSAFIYSLCMHTSCNWKGKISTSSIKYWRACCVIITLFMNSLMSCSVVWKVQWSTSNVSGRPLYRLIINSTIWVCVYPKAMCRVLQLSWDELLAKEEGGLYLYRWGSWIALFDVCENNWSRKLPTASIGDGVSTEWRFCSIF